jgi:hypothetical protein
LPTKDFRTELAVGYSLELFLSMLPMLFCIIFNNSEAISKSGDYDAAKIEAVIEAP